MSMRVASSRVLLPALTLAVVLFAPVKAFAIPITVVGNSTGSLSTATGSLVFNDTTNTLTLTLTNTSPFDARITGIGFDIFSGNANGFSGANVAGFTFSDGGLGTVPQFNTAELDFGFTTGNSGNFNGGSANDGLAPGGTLTFIVTGAAFGSGLTEQQLADDLFVRFQRVGADGEGSDVGTVRVPDVSSTLSLLGLGLAGLTALRRRLT
jgi:hypothetical protein